MMDKTYPTLCDDKQCTGCSACFNSCPTNAISIKQNREGFYRPIINADLCIKCHKCERACPIITRFDTVANSFTPQLFAGWHRNEQIRNNSSSGGAFSALATTILANGGIVYGAAYDSNMRVNHCRVESLDDLYKLRLSKYAQSYIGNIFRDIKVDLDNGLKVLFCGTPCQASGLKGFLKKDYPNMIICDFICHGVPSPLILKSYKEWLEDNGINNITKINFRDKRKGWYDAVRVAENNHNSYVLKGRMDNYWIGFNGNLNLQECCYNCQFLGIDRKTDITIADFWGIGKEYPFGHISEIKKGVSAIIISTSKGRELLQQSADLLELFQRDLGEITKGNAAIITASNRPKQRDSFYIDLVNQPYQYMIKEYLKPDIKSKLVKFYREYLPACITTKVRERSQK